MTTAQASLSGKNRRSGIMAAFMGLGMLALGFAAVPLYDVFCRVTGYGGTTQRVGEAEAATVHATSQVVSIRFDSNVNSALPWSFKPEQAVDNVTVGARDMAIFIATNNSDQPVVGTATFNVTPLLAGQYFNKVQCFCFSEQVLKPGQTVRMPVLYYVDPAIMDDPETKDIKEITLSYTFYRSIDQQALDAGAGDS
ncbi:cytochrome c oxidase assembly protein [Parasphingorhabdus sp.]|uniref:cytochrome c oxidase assembly protein n=1 Tax=Parasphingorhabdus sp. TaxID=2709688 RepID=UPI0030A27833|nr:cytochrome c oxidase assembly protein [Sphingomonadales bacterium]